MEEMAIVWTFTYADGHKVQLDYTMINRKWTNSAKNCESYHSRGCILSDHRIVTLKIKLSLRTNKVSSAANTNYTWEILQTNDKLQKQYSVAVRNRYETLQTYDANNQM